MRNLSIFLLVVFVGIGLSTQAQIQRGNVMVGANFANISLDLDKPNIFSANITPKAAWFVQDNIALGGYLDFGIVTGSGSTTTNYGVGALGRYYTGSDVEILRHGRLFGEATVGFGGQNVSGPIDGSTNGINFSVGPGFAYFITPNIGVEALFKYNGLGGFGNIGYQNNLNLSFGLQIYLPGRSTVNKVGGDIR